MIIDSTIHVVYLAHPVGAATADGVAENLKSARAWLRFLIDACPDVAWCVSWLPYLDVLEDSGASRARGLRDDCAMVARCDAILAVGHCLSSGMRREIDAASEAGLDVIEAVGTSAVDVAEIVNAWAVRR